MSTRRVTRPQDELWLGFIVGGRSVPHGKRGPEAPRNRSDDGRILVWQERLLVEGR